MKLTQFGLNLAGGQFIKDDLAITANLGYMMFKPEDTGTFSVFTIGAGVRYYLPSNLFGGIGLSHNSATMKSERYYDEEYDEYEDGEKITFSALLVAFEAGYSINLTENIAFEPSLNYSLSLSGKAKSDGVEMGDFDLSRFGISLGITVFF